MRLRRAALALLAVLLALPFLAGCTGGGSGESASDLLAKAKKALDSAKTVHFVLSSGGAPSTGTVLTGGEGDIARPSSFRGTLKVQAAGTPVDLKVVSSGGTVYAQLPFASTYSTIDPATFGFGDPGKLLDPTTGISQLLTATTNAKLGDQKRVGGQVVREVTGQIPGDLVQRLLTSKDPSTPVQARYSIATDSGQLLRAALTGPFFVKGQDGTYTLDLSKYGADVTITAPPTS